MTLTEALSHINIPTPYGIRYIVYTNKFGEHRIRIRFFDGNILSPLTRDLIMAIIPEATYSNWSIKNKSDLYATLTGCDYDLKISARISKA